jgi:signal peptidase I
VQLRGEVRGGSWREEPCVQFVEKLEGHRYGTYCTPYLPCGDVEPQKVPPGHVFVLGDHRDHSADSRVYGPIFEEAIVARASYVLFSVGPSGIRWDRLGVPIP